MSHNLLLISRKNRVHIYEKKNRKEEDENDQNEK